MAHEAGHETDAVKRCSESELTDDELAQVAGGTEGPPTGAGDNNGAR